MLFYHIIFLYLSFYDIMLVICQSILYEIIFDYFFGTMTSEFIRDML